MALKDCSECGSKTSDSAYLCPNCGHPQQAAATARTAIVDLDLPFTSMVGFMVKWVIASIPAMFILLVLGAFLVMVLGSLLGIGRFR